MAASILAFKAMGLPYLFADFPARLSLVACSALHSVSARDEARVPSSGLLLCLEEMLRIAGLKHLVGLARETPTPGSAVLERCLLLAEHENSRKSHESSWAVRWQPAGADASGAHTPAGRAGGSAPINASRRVSRPSAFYRLLYSVCKLGKQPRH